MNDDATPEKALEELSFLVGQWTVKGQIAPATLGAAGQFGGDVVGQWGPRKSWIRLEQTSTVGPAGSYAVVVLVFHDLVLGKLRAFSVNSYSSGQVFEGRIVRQGEVAFTTDPASESVQRVTYARIDPERVRFSVELSKDGGDSLLPFSEAVWSPRIE